MTKIGRIGNVLTGLFMLALGLVFALEPTKVYKVLILVLGLTMLLAGIRSLHYYITMARHMVDGKTVLYRAVIIIDLGLFSTTLMDVPLIFVVLYLAGIHGFAGFVDIMRMFEARRLQAPSWKLNLSSGLGNMIMAGLCLAFLGTVQVAVVIYSLGVMYSGLIRIIQACRRTPAVYIR